MLFTDLKLSEPIQKRLAEKGFAEPTPIQAETIPLALNNRDLIACAKTGSGKTLAFLLPILQYVQNQNARPSAASDDSSSSEGLTDRAVEGRSPQFDTLTDRAVEGPVALVLAPTRELVVQIAEEAEFFAEAASLRMATIFGGVDHDKQRRELAHNPQLIVATPGRLLDFLRGGEINLKQTVRIVLDEADRMLDMGFIDDVRKILSKCSANENENRQFSLFSATINFSALYSVWEFMREPEEILINPELIDHASIEQEMLHLGQDEKLPYLIQFLEANKLEPVIIFTNSRQYVDVLVKNLNHHNIAAEGLSSMVTQNRRLRILDDFKENKFRVLVATDVASRGLHIEDIQLVVNYDIPMDSETYVHRIGRTARAGKTGKAMSFSSEFDYDSLAKLERYLKYKIPVTQPEQRFIENTSFVRIVSVARQDGADHLRSSRGRDASKGRERRGERGMRRGEARAQGASGRNESRGRDKRPGRRDQGKEASAGMAPRHEGKQRDGAYFDSRRPRQNHEVKARTQAKQNQRETFAIVSRDAKKSGFFARLASRFKSLFSSKKSQPQISERTRRLIEQERQEHRGNNRGPKRGARNGRRHRTNQKGGGRRG